jgi:hypothetical protein
LIIDELKAELDYSRTVLSAISPKEGEDGDLRIGLIEQEILPTLRELSSFALVSADSDIRFLMKNEAINLWNQPLYDGDEPLTILELLINLEKDPWLNNYWSNWLSGLLKGVPIDWNLQREVALIPDADWDKGPAHIAELIEEIKARFDVQNAAKKAKEYLSQTPLPPHSGIGHNQPPEPLDMDAPPNIDLDEINEKLNQILDATNNASSNTKQLRPSDNFIKTTMISIARYIGQKADLAVDVVIKDPIKAAGYIAIAAPVIDYFVGLLIKLKSLVEVLASYIPFL